MKRLINFTPSRIWRIGLALLPFAAIILLYISASDARLAENAADKLLPSFSQMGDAIQRLAFEPSKRSGDYLFWQDTVSSLRRLGLGMLIAASLGMFFGLMPVLFIVFGLGEVSKVALIAIGVTPFIARDIQKRTLEIPREQLVKAQTLGANSGQIILRVLIPQLMPRLIDAVRLSLGSAWLFLIAAEAIASTDGLGYRVFLVRRYLSMDVILPYVAWVTVLAFTIDYLLAQLSRFAFPWHAQQEGKS